LLNDCISSISYAYTLDMENTTYTTAPITTTLQADKHLAQYTTEHYTINTISEGIFTITFNDAFAATWAIDKAKAVAFSAYIKNGGNPRNKRSFGSSFAGAKKAILALEAGN